MKPTARSLILELLSAGEGRPLPARLAVAACDLFGIRENSVRVALVRLSSEGRIESAGRGEYGLTEDAANLGREVAGWRQAESRVCKWQGAYLAVHTGALGRSDKRALRHRSRALSLLGLGELERGLHVRPDNLRGGVESARVRLQGLGLEPHAAVFRADSFSPELEERIRGLWDGRALTASYTRSRRELERWIARFKTLDPETAARESFLLGSRAIRQIVYDPLLPSPFVDVEERRAFIDRMKEMDAVGRRIWRRFFLSVEASYASSAVVH